MIDRPERIVQIDAGNAYLLPFARSLLARLWTAAPNGPTKAVSAGPNGIQIEVSIVAGVGRIRITGGSGSGAQLYSWPTATTAISHAVRNIALGAVSDTTPASQMVTSVIAPNRAGVVNVPLTALGAKLGFDFNGQVGTSFIGSLSGTNQPPLLTKSRMLNLLKRMVKARSWFAYELLSWFIARSTFVRHGITFAVVQTDCLFSDTWDTTKLGPAPAADQPDTRPELGFYLMLGQWPGGTLTTIPADTVKFKGVVVPFGALDSAMEPVSPTVWTVNLDSTAKLGAAPAADQADNRVMVKDLVIDAETDDYKRPIMGSLTIGDSSSSQTINAQLLIRKSPYAWAYLQTADNQTSVNIGNFSNNGTVRHYAGTLSPAGALVTTDLHTGIVQGTATESVHSESTFPSPFSYSLDAMTCDLAFFTGERFRTYGQHSFSGGFAAGGVGLPHPDTGYSVTYTADLPVASPSFFNDTTPIDREFVAYLQDFDLALIGKDTTPTSTITAERFDGSRRYSATVAGFTAQIQPTVDFPQVHPSGDYSQSSASTGGPNGVGDQLVTVTEFQRGPQITKARGSTPDFPEGDALPNTPFSSSVYRVNGVYWPRETGLGVLFFQVPADLTERTTRTADVNTYRQIKLKNPLYAPATDTTPAGAKYEDPEVVITRIMSRTTVLLNNFASPAFIAWIDDGFVGIILDN